MFAEDEEVVQQVQNAVKENVKKIAGDGESEQVEEMESGTDRENTSEDDLGISQQVNEESREMVISQIKMFQIQIQTVWRRVI